MSSKFCRKHFVRQLDSRQCGIASLAMICHYLGINVSTSFLSKFCDTSKEGISLKGISDVASHIGLENKAYHLSIEELLNVLSHVLYIGIDLILHKKGLLFVQVRRI